MGGEPTQKQKIAVDRAGDYASFAVHGLGNAALLAAVTTVVATPAVTAAAAALTLAVKFGLGPAIKKAFREALPTEETDLSVAFNRAGKRSPEIQIKLRSAFEKVAEFSERMGVTSQPSFHFLDRDAKQVRRSAADKKSFLREVMREFLTEYFNKFANAAAFSSKRSAVILTRPLVEKLEEREINAVAAHEVGHIAAQHNFKTGLMGLMAAPAKFTAMIYSLLVTFSSWKNFGLVILGNVIGYNLAKGYAALRGLNLEGEDKRKDKAEFATVRGLAQKVAKVGLGLAFAAPDLVLATGLSFGTDEVAKLLSKSYSRANEYQADRLAAEATRDPMALVSGLDKARKHNISFEKGMDMTPPDAVAAKGWLSGLFRGVKELYSTHPTNENRRAQMEKMALAMT